MFTLVTNVHEHYTLSYLINQEMSYNPTLNYTTSLKTGVIMSKNG